MDLSPQKGRPLEGIDGDRIAFRIWRTRKKLWSLVEVLTGKWSWESEARLGRGRLRL